MDYNTLLSAAHNYIYAYNDLRRSFPNGVYIGRNASLHSDSVQKYISRCRNEAVLNALCECTGIPEAALIKAARVEDHYYARGGTRCLNAEQLIRSLL